MKNVSPEALSYCSNFYFTFSKTLRNQSVNLNDYASATFIIDVDGRVSTTNNKYSDKLLSINSFSIKIFKDTNIMGKFKSFVLLRQYQAFEYP